jgi:nitrile hydratase
MDTTRRSFLTAAGAVAADEALRAQDHDHEDHAHQAVPSDPDLRVKALESELVEKGLVEPAALDLLIDTYENKIGPRNGARVVAHAWVDPAYKQRVLADATAAVKELGFTGVDDVLAVENTAKLHNLVVCTLCSYYPWSVLGLPPVWYKSETYRSRSVMTEEQLAALVTRDSMVGVAKVTLSGA